MLANFSWMDFYYYNHLSKKLFLQREISPNTTFLFVLVMPFLRAFFANAYQWCNAFCDGREMGFFPQFFYNKNTIEMKDDTFVVLFYVYIIAHFFFSTQR